ncbi:hypothetical protein, partial [Endozoicomonas atrinae]|uniref:hypothetical protein n=1 Tax=Endozoicomonas atrinae TaxID=1333660 RepID=UPI001EE7218B
IAVSKAFVGSLIPMKDPHFSINPCKALQDIGRLAAVSVLPASNIIFMVKDIADAWSGSRLPGPDVKPESPQESKATGEKAEEKEPCPKKVTLQQPPTALHQGSQSTKGLLALGMLASSVQYANSKSIADGSKPIGINDAETLGKIGQDPDYPLDGNYQQTADIDATQALQSIGNDTHPFTGQYHGQCHTISNLSDCFVKKLDQGSISHLRFIDAHIT